MLALLSQFRFRSRGRFLGHFHGASSVAALVDLFPTLAADIPLTVASVESVV